MPNREGSFVKPVSNIENKQSESERVEINKEPKEIERKFLIKKLPEGINPESAEAIVQGYLAIDVNGTEVRLRQKGNKYFQTVKTAGQAIRNEWETEITKEQFEVFWPATIDRRLEKTRYEISYEGIIVELDIYGGNLKGLITAEIEFDSEGAAKEFIAPDWLKEEVTEDDRFRNKNLINLSPDQLKAILENN